MQKRENAVTLKGGGLTLLGPALKPGDIAPDFICATGMKDLTRLTDTPAKPRLFSVVPSLDTKVCSIQTKKFAEELAKLGDSIACYTVSMDLPFAQSRFCSAENVSGIKNLSDTHNHSFGKAYGVLIDGLAMPLLCRAVFVVDASGIIKHAEYVSEIASEPDYASALSALRS